MPAAPFRRKNQTLRQETNGFSQRMYPLEENCKGICCEIMTVYITLDECCYVDKTWKSWNINLYNMYGADS